MYDVQQITDAFLQKQTPILTDGTPLQLQIKFVPLQFGWFIDSLVYKDFVLNGFRISNSPNMLYQFKNLIPFGLACISKGDREPTLQQDFLSGASKLYILSAEEVQQYSDFLSGLNG